MTLRHLQSNLKASLSHFSADVLTLPSKCDFGCGHNKRELFSLIKLWQDTMPWSLPILLSSSLSMVLFEFSLGRTKSRAVSVLDFRKLDNKGVKGHGEFGVQTKYLCKMVKLQLITRRKTLIQDHFITRLVLEIRYDLSQCGNNQR